MIIRLGGVTLNPSMNWSDRFQSSQVAQTVNRTVGGRAIVFATPLKAGRKITLESTQDNGWIDYPTVQVLLGMAEIVGGVFLFECGDENGYIEQFNVVFRHNEPPALELAPHVHRPSHESTDVMYGKIKLLTI